MEETGALMEDHLALLNLEGEYARTWDTGDAEGWSSLCVLVSSGRTPERG